MTRQVQPSPEVQRSRRPLVGLVLWAVAVTVGLGLRRFDVIDALLLFGPLVVVPLGLPLLDLGDRPATGGESLILPTAAALAVAFLLPVSG